MIGTVILTTGALCEVRLFDGSTVKASLKGKIRTQGLRTTNPIAVGDRVVLEADMTGKFLITSIEPRTNYIIRKAVNLSKEAHIIAANLDRALVVCTLSSPRTSTGFISRFLVTARAYGIPAGVVVNKCDLLTPADHIVTDYILSALERAGYLCFRVSALTGLGLDTLRNEMSNGISLLSGHSGAGKSSLINSMFPGNDLRTGAISEAHGKGKHTTTYARMIMLPSAEGGLIDTPGIKGFGLVDMPRDDIRLYFPEMFALQSGCRFAGCLHLEEPGCAVKAAVESEEIAGFRYADYLSILEDCGEGRYRPSGR